jgi:Ca-activated chloride channel family protein
MFSRIETVEGYFNLGNAWAHSRNYLLAVRAYDDALDIDPGHAGALKNRKMIQDIIDSINLLSESQRAEQGEASQQLGDDDPQTAEGAERVKFGERELEQLTAEQVLLDESMNEIWMRQVQRDPSRFLSVKFHMQLQRGEL